MRVHQDYLVWRDLQDQKEQMEIQDQREIQDLLDPPDLQALLESYLCCHPTFCSSEMLHSHDAREKYVEITETEHRGLDLSRTVTWT